jgi:peptidoglycan/LPS O-acetylase OafA/YrhL
MRKRTVFDGVFAAYVAALVAPMFGEFVGPGAYVGTFAGFWFVVYTGMRASETKLRGLPERVGRRPTATFLIVFPLVYGIVYIIGALVAEPPVRSPYVYLGLWSVGVGIVTVAVARETAGAGSSPKRVRKES